MDENTNFIDVYRQEADELLVEIEEAVLGIEENPEEKEAINRLFRAVHTIKGSGAMFGFEKIVNFTHTLETVLDKLRDGLLPITRELIDMVLKSKDHIKTILESSSDNDTIDKDYENLLIKGLNDFLVAANENADKKAIIEAEKIVSEEHTNEVTYRIRFQPQKEIFSSGIDPALLLDELLSFGEAEVTPHLNNIPFIDELNPEECHVYWDIILTTRKKEDTLRDIFIFVEDQCNLTIDLIDEETGTESVDNVKKLGEILLERKDVTPEELNNALSGQKRIGELLVDSSVVDTETVTSALTEQNQVKKLREKRKEEKNASSLRVSADKLDILVDLVGELVTVQARLSQKAASHGDSEFITISEEIERLTADLRDNTMGIRMMPIGTIFSKFKRLVRDLGNELGKDVELSTEGSETELDKTVIERLNDPLIHIIRNSIDHGIELPDVREKAGKPGTGTVCLKAEHAGANVLISISDDGKGLDKDAIYAKAMEKGLISNDAALSEEEIFAFILTPGFSTAKTITDVSGRGVGMDVVKRAIENLRGSIEIKSVKEKGTTITLKLPLTLAIIDGLLMQIGNTHFVIPLNSVDECVELSSESANSRHGRHIIKVRDELVSYVPLRELFGILSERPPIEQIVITEQDGHRVGFAVDQIIGEHQTVIKSLGGFYKNIQGFSGATILADGTVALILDVNGLSEAARKAEEEIIL
ncbi:MAG: chemotaxis protein CheA [Deltaproteobacteria bacterium]|nr:chemotaxis protein CheA [Deltaproteobacteria bacterium]